MQWIVRKSADGGSTWSTVDDFLVTPYGGQLNATAFGSDANGNLFVSGYRYLNGTGQWLVRESLAGSGSWQTVDTFDYASGNDSEPFAVVGGGSGHVFVAGYGKDGSGVEHWLIRKH